ncbi:hypothetical protein LIER_22775 [Lithospermum erythrorhizon]|uniref:Uncharacterized protein n=1 Tax=Lithospermum erythrorhizon TaxID=34254 RepID=A0AAV3QXL1_LITER
MGKKSKMVKLKSKFSPLSTKDYFKDLETPPVHFLNPTVSVVFHELEEALLRTSRVFDDSPISTPRVGLGKLVEGDVRDGSAMGDVIPSVDCSTPVVDEGCCGVAKVSVGAGKDDLRAARGKGKEGVEEEVTLGMEDVEPLEDPKGFCLARYFSGRFSDLRAIH